MRVAGRKCAGIENVLQLADREIVGSSVCMGDLAPVIDDGPQLRTLYVTAGKTLYQVPVNVSGYAVYPPLKP